MTFPWPDDKQLHRLEWWRFLIAASMILTMVSELLLQVLLGWYSLWVWLAVIALQGSALHRMTKVITRERKRMTDEFIAEILKMRAESS